MFIILQHVEEISIATLITYTSKKTFHKDYLTWIILPEMYCHEADK